MTKTFRIRKQENGSELGRLAQSNKLRLILATLLLASLMVSLSGASLAGATASIGLSQFQQLWDRSDRPVADQKAVRSWTWGPAYSGLLTEPYAEGSNRQVQYFDKTRMEQTSGRSVTNGLLAKELITGQLQLGDNKFQQFQANGTINIAGDQYPANLPNPTYASFRKVATIDLKENRATDLTGKPVTATIAKDGSTGKKDALAGQYNVTNAYFEPTLSHNIPNVFWNFMNQTGVVYKDGQYVNDRVFDWAVAIGLPLTDAYWSRSVVGGKEQDVLVQAFERRVLTYTPSNPEQWRVEMGNVGQHYLVWRQQLGLPSNPTPAPTTAPATTTPPVTTTAPATTTPPVTTTAPATTTPAVTTTAPATTTPAITTPPTAPPTTPPTGTPGPTVTVPPVSVGWNGAVQLASLYYRPVLFAPAMKVRPTDGTAFIMGESGANEDLLLTTSTEPSRPININDTAANGNKRSQLSFAPNGTAFFTWRTFKESTGYIAYMRRMLPNGTLLPGQDLNAMWRAAGGPADMDLPTIYVSPYSGKVYVSGQIKVANGGTPAWGFAESNNGGASLTNATIVAGPQNLTGHEIKPRICTDKNDNIHMIGFWNGDVATVSRVNGQWTGLKVMTNGAALAYGFIGQAEIACSQDGYAFGVFHSVNANNSGFSTGLVRFTPGRGWELVNYDIYGLNISKTFLGGIPGTDGASVTVTPDNTVWVATGVNNGPYAGVIVSSSGNRGQSFTAPQQAIGHGATNQGVDIDYSTVGGKLKLHVAATFKEPSPRISYYTNTK